VGRLFLRIFLWFWLASTSLLVVLIIGFLIFQPDPDVLASWRIIGRGAVTAVGSMAANAYEHSGEAGVKDVLSDFSRNADLQAWLYGPDSGLLSGPLPASGVQDLVRRAFEKDEAESKSSGGTILVARRIQSDSGKEYVIVWQAPSRLKRRLFTTKFGMRMASLVVTGGLVCLWLTWYITRPIRTLRGATRRFSRGDLAVRVSTKRELRRGDALSDLANDFDDMAARIEELVKSQQQLLADISHELRSPLARISLAVDLARRRSGEGIPEHQRIEREVLRLNDLIEQLLTLARLQVHPGNSKAESVDLGSIVLEIADDARFEAESKNKRVLVRQDCNAIVHGSFALLRSAIENVVRNAVRHTPENGEVTIDMENAREPGRVVIAVRDQGSGVPASALDRLFDPFFRVEEGRDRDSGGVGLGLAIVRQAALFHGGQVCAQNHPDGGLLVRLEFPTMLHVETLS
jgi:two-component system, OmpR family, sensor histidine kinase CpxA